MIKIVVAAHTAEIEVACMCKSLGCQGIYGG